jgi:NADPH:quinone reductase-like Zn-dependent oxidoreductase
MKALAQDRYGSPEEVLRMAEIPQPVCGDDEVLVRVHASSANPWDWHFIRGEPVLMRPAGLGGVRRPKFPVPGGDVAGIVEAVGGSVSSFAPGDEVYGFGHGAFAEYVAVSARKLAKKPTSLSFAEAAAVPLCGVTALQGLRAGGLRAGQNLLIIGASGGVGTFAVQIAKHLGARVTVVSRTANTQMVGELGADAVIDYMAGGFPSSEPRYDMVLQLGGTYSPRTLRRMLKADGTLVQSFGDGSRLVGPLGNIVAAAALNVFVSQTLKSFVADENTETLDELRELIDSGHVRPVIDSSFALEQAAAAVSRVESGHPAGKVVVTVDSAAS